MVYKRIFIIYIYNNMKIVLKAGNLKDTITIYKSKYLNKIYNFYH